uniref:Uncharacterized protein n=1 Tax=Trichinella nativa TaxID=6335 RepID=A0A0V1JW28_9BILA
MDRSQEKVMHLLETDAVNLVGDETQVEDRRVTE